MRTIEVGGKPYKVRNMREITHRAVLKVRNLPAVLFFDKVNIGKIMAAHFDGSGQDNEKMAAMVFVQELASDTEKFVQFMRTMDVSDELENNAVLMLTMDLEYEDILNLPEPDYHALIEEAEKEFPENSGVMGFFDGLNINLEAEMNFGTMVKKVSEMTTTKS